MKLGIIIMFFTVLIAVLLEIVLVAAFLWMAWFYIAIPIFGAMVLPFWSFAVASVLIKIFNK